MTLPSYGVSLGMQQIATEFSSGTVYPMNQYYAGGSYVPSGTNGYPSGGSATPIPTSGTITINNFYGSAKSTAVRWEYAFEGITGADNYYNTINTVGVDTTGNSYATGFAAGNTSSNNISGLWVKISPSGSILAANRLTSAQNYQVVAGATAPSGNTYVAMGQSVTYAGNTYILKIDTSGNIVWEYLMTSNQPQFLGFVVAPSSENIYFLTFNTVPLSIFLTKVNSSGSVQWSQEIYHDPNILDNSSTLSIDASENVNVLVAANDSTHGAAWYYLIYNSSGTQTTAQYYYTSASGSLAGIAGGRYSFNTYSYIDSSTKLYLCLPLTTSGGQPQVYVTKYGVWSYTFNLPSYGTINGMTVDSSGNTYLAYASTNYALSIIVINAAGTSFTQYVAGAYHDNFSYGIQVLSNGQILIGSNTTTTGYFYQAGLSQNFTALGTPEVTTGSLTLTAGTGSALYTSVSLSWSSSSFISTNSTLYVSTIATLP
jgi:hypothetical protein